MPAIVYVNGRYLPRARAAVALEDRGYQFADGVYEVILALGGRPLDREAHLDRLDRSLGELGIAPPMSRAALCAVIDRLLRINRVQAGTLYLQVTRGVAPRDHPFPDPPVPPALAMGTRRFDLDALRLRQDRGIAVRTAPDLRWRRCDIKSIALTANVLAKQAAREAGAAEAWMVGADGRITEGASTTAWILDARGRLRTRRLGPEILPGITREVLLVLAREEGFTVVEEPFTPAEATAAREAFTASTTSFVTPVVEIDGAAIGGGAPGPLTRALITRHRAHVAAETGVEIGASGAGAAGRRAARIAS